MSLGQKVKELRKREGLSQAELATLVGVTSSYISRLERDKYGKPSAAILVRLAKVLRVEPRVLFEEAGYQQKTSEQNAMVDLATSLTDLSSEAQQSIMDYMRFVDKKERRERKQVKGGKPDCDTYEAM